MMHRRPLVMAMTVLLAFLLVGQSGSPPSAATPRKIEGLVSPSRRVVLIAPVEGMLLHLAVTEGRDVKADEVVARLDDRLQTLAVEAAELRANSTSELEQAEAVLEEAKIQSEQMRDAFSKGAASPLEVRRADLQEKQASLAVDAARDMRKLAATNLRLEKQRLDLYTIRAPFDGRVMRVGVEQGANLARGEEMIALASFHPLRATLFLPVELYGKLEIGRTYRLDAAAPVHRQLEARLTVVDPQIDAASQTFRCVFEIDNENLSLPGGFTVVLHWPQP
jgi:membrane fusion protein (multidrug efflux system)